MDQSKPIIDPVAPVQSPQNTFLQSFKGSGVIRLILWLMVVSTTLSWIGLLFAVPVFPLGIQLITFPPILLLVSLCLALHHLGRDRFSAAVFCVGMIGLMTGMLTVFEGVLFIGVISYVNVILIAGFSLGVPGALVASLLTTACLILVYWLDAHAQLPPPLFTAAPAGAAVATIFSMVTTGLLVAFGVYQLRFAVREETGAQLQSELSRAKKGRARDAQRAMQGQQLAQLGNEVVRIRNMEQLGRKVVESVRDTLGAEAVALLDPSGTVLAVARLGGLWCPTSGSGLPSGQSLIKGLTAQQRSSMPVSGAELADLRVGPESIDKANSHGLAVVIPNRGGAVIAVFEPGVAITELHDEFLGAAASILAAGQDRNLVEQDLVQTERMEAIGLIAGGIAHDFNNLLTAILGNVEVLAHPHPSERDDARIRTHLANIRWSVAHATTLTHKLQAFAGKSRLPSITISLGELIKEMIPVLNEAVRSPARLEVEVPPIPLNVRAAPGDIEQVVLNLVLNAVDAIEEDGCVRVRLYPNPDQSSVCLVVEDDGSGMTPDVKKNIFAPFFTTKPAGHGTGLGLATVYGILESLEGDIDIVSSPGTGSQFQINLPLVTTKVASNQVAVSTRTIVVVDDNDLVREAVVAMLRSAGFSVEAFGSAKDAWNRLKQEAEVGLVLTDIVMPEMDGPELVRRMVSKGMKVPVLLMSGFTEEERDGWTKAEVQELPCLSKPIPARTLISAVKDRMIH